MIREKRRHEGGGTRIKVVREERWYENKGGTRGEEGFPFVSGPLPKLDSYIRRGKRQLSGTQAQYLEAREVAFGATNSLHSKKAIKSSTKPEMTHD